MYIIWVDNDATMQKMFSWSFMSALIHKTTPVTSANICSALSIEDLKLDHVFNLSELKKNEIFHVTVICSEGLLRPNLFLYTVNTHPVTSSVIFWQTFHMISDNIKTWINVLNLFQQVFCS